MYSEILQFVWTKEELTELSREIDLLLSSLYQDKGAAYDQVLRSRVRAKVATLIESAIAQSQTPKEKFLKGLAAELAKAKVLRLTLAFEPTKEAVEKIHKWISLNVEAQVVLDITYDKSILGGAIISFEGNYRDFNLGKTHDVKFEARKKAIVSILNS